MLVTEGQRMVLAPFEKIFGMEFGTPFPCHFTTKSLENFSEGLTASRSFRYM